MEAKGIVRLPHVKWLGREVAGVVRLATTFGKLLLLVYIFFTFSKSAGNSGNYVDVEHSQFDKKPIESGTTSRTYRQSRTQSFLWINLYAVTGIRGGVHFGLFSA